MDDLFEAVIALGVTGLIFLLLIVGGRQIDHHYEQNKCHGFGQATGRVVKWADYSFWNYECLTPSKDGKWVTTDQLREM